MSMARIRAYYGVPAKHGMKILFRDQPATIIGATQDAMRLKIRHTTKPKTTHQIHPTWQVQYPETGTQK